MGSRLEQLPPHKKFLMKIKARALAIGNKTPMKSAPLRYALADVPRYTSYPTAAEFHDGVGEAEYRMWLGSLTAKNRLSLYVHVPFCQKLCWYCGCHTTIPRDYDRIAPYLGALRRELTLLSKAIPSHGGVSHLHFGGGTPNILSSADFVGLMREINRKLPFAPGAEIAVELDPRALTEAKAEAFARAGVNRVSIGVQDFGPHIQAKINRIQPYYVVARAVEWLRSNGVTNINFDLMYGLPGQTVEDVERSAELAASLHPGRIAVFGYAHVPWFKKHQRMINEGELPGPAARFAQANTAACTLKNLGYLEVGFDHFAYPGDSLAEAALKRKVRRNFQGYTTDPTEVLLGLGASSIGQLPQGYVQSAPSLDIYRETVEAGRLPIVRGVEVTAEDRLRRDAIERLMCDLQVDLAAVCARHNRPPTALDDALGSFAILADDGLVELHGRRVVVREQGRRFLRNAAACLDVYLRAKIKRHSKAV
jgi:oxygen-independent coproporphyrinogen-3 oxidase